jgi:hypothetical protein
MNIDKLLRWLDENKNEQCTFYLKKDIPSKLDGSVIAFSSFDSYDASGDWENPMLHLKSKDIIVLNIFLYDIQRFTVRNKELNFYINTKE